MSKPIMAAMLSCSSTGLTDDEKRLFEKANPLGISLFSRNITNREQTRELIREIKETIGRNDLLIAVDQEGGRVRRLAEPEFRSYAAAITLESLGASAPKAAALHAALISDDLKTLGINMNYAPSLDIIYPETTPALKSRCFSSSKLVVANLGKTMVDEYIKQGICPCIKHLPGHGRAAVDPHLNLPRLDNSLDDLAQDFYPFRQLNDAPAGMTAHIIISAVDEHRPITQSPDGIKEVIRGIIGFEGLLISDAIDMHALKGSVTEKTLTSLQAGCDAVCYALGDISELREIAAVCPPLSEPAKERLSRIAQITALATPSKKISSQAAEYAEIIGTVEPYRDDYDATEVLNKLINKGEIQC